MADDEQNKKHPEPELTRKQHIPLKEYGLLKVLEWPDGTVITINTKKGEENMRIHHSSGVYHEFTSEGTHVQFNSNNKVEYSKGGMTVTWDQSGDHKAAGHMRVNFDHDAHVTFKKNASMVVGGKTDIASMGHIKMIGDGNVYLGSNKGKVVINGGKGIELKGEDGRVMIEAAHGALYLHSKEGDVHLEAKEDVVMNSGMHNITIAKGNIAEEAQGDIGEVAQGKVSSKGSSVFSESSGNMNLKGQDIKIGGGNIVQVKCDSPPISAPPWEIGGENPSSAPKVSHDFQEG